MYKVEKALNNNVVIAHDDLEEVVLIGRGIGFGAKENDKLDTGKADKVYKLTGKQDTKRLRQLQEICRVVGV